MSARVEIASTSSGLSAPPVPVSPFATVGGGLLAAGIALLALVRRPEGAIEVGLASFAGALILVSLAVLIVYGLQMNPPYPFIQEAVRFQRPWKWFYRDALTNSDAFTLPILARQTKNQVQRSIDEFDAQWEDFGDRYLGLLDPHTDALQNLRQVYLLHVNEKYKNHFLSQLRRILVWGLVTSTVVGVASGLVTLGVSSRSEPPAEAPSPQVSTSKAAAQQD
jgi:hypothetical protein